MEEATLAHLVHLETRLERYLDDPERTPRRGKVELVPTPPDP
jgi:hypothetical protein